MKTKTPRTPTLRRHKASNRAYVELSGRRFYLGRWGSPESLEAYHRALAEWLANGRRISVPESDLTVVELIAAYWPDAVKHYCDPEGNPTSSINAVKEAARRLKEFYGQHVGCGDPKIS